MSVLGFARCEQCKRVVNEVICWPSAAHAIKHVCRSCYAGLRASSAWVRSTAGNTANCAYKLPPAPELAPPDAVRKRYPIPEGCEWRFLWTLWHVHRGLREPLRNRMVVSWPTPLEARQC